MKKLNILLSGLLVFGAVLTSCDNDKDMPPVTYPGENGQATTEPRPLGIGTWDDPYNVWQVLAGIEPVTDDLCWGWVHGYIVGFINTDLGIARLCEQTAVIGKVGTVQSNILLSGVEPNEDYSNIRWQDCIPVNFEFGFPARDELKLNTNPQMLGKEVCLYGVTGYKYRTEYGLRKCMYYKLGSEGYELDEGPGAVAPGSETYLTNNMDGFTIENVVLPAEIKAIWTWDSSYKQAKASAYANKNFAADSYLISPEIELTPEATTMSFQQATAYLYGAPITDYFNVYIRVGKGEWELQKIDVSPDTNTWWDWATTTIDLTPYAGKTIQVAFRYTSTSSTAGTWEVKNMVVNK